MLYYISISQRDMVEFDLDLDFNDMAIYYLYKHIVISGCAKKMEVNKETYLQFTRQFIIDQLPRLKIKTKIGISNRLNNLIDAGLLKPYPFNQAEGVSFFAFGDVHFAISEKELSFTPINENLPPYKNSFTPPINEFLHNNLSNSTSKQLTSKEERTFSENLHLPNYEKKDKSLAGGTYVKFDESEYVKLTHEQYNNLVAKYSEAYVLKCVEKLDTYIATNPAEPKRKAAIKQNHFVLFNQGWVKKAVEEDKAKGGRNGAKVRIDSSVICLD